MINALVIIAALGYFVDIYDLILFSIVRVPSLQSLGLSGEALLSQGLFILNAQMLGMLLGGIIWGVLGDKKGRLSVLFGSILLYSLANLANAFVTNVPAYALLRFVAGIGLAGELGAGITLVMETLPKSKRGIGATIVASFGVAGAILAGVIAEYFSWRMAYGIGGVMGLLLLVLRVSAFESGLYQDAEKKKVKRGAFLSLFKRVPVAARYLKCILIGLPLWYVIGVLVTFSPEIALALGITEPVHAGRAVMFCYGGLIVGDLASGFLSQWLQSRKKAICFFLLLMGITGSIYLFLIQGYSAWAVYWICLGLGFSSGYWVLFVTVGAESFGTNYRATVATTVPNFVRGAVVPIGLLFKSLKQTMGIVNSGAVVGALCIAIAFLSLITLEETFHKDMDFLEEL